MKPALKQFFRHLDRSVDKVRRLSSTLRDEIGLSGFAYVRVYHNGRISWVTSDSDHDRLLVDCGFLEEDPLVDSSKCLKEGCHLWFHDREFEGSDKFYHNREKYFQLDHGMVLVNHHEDYLETGCFSGFLKRKPLYNLFIRETGFFRSFLQYASKELEKDLVKNLECGIKLADLKNASSGKANSMIDEQTRQRFLIGQGKAELLRLTKRERENLSYLRMGLTYREIGDKLGISYRTVEHHLESAKDKLGLINRQELRRLADQLHDIGLI